MIASARALFLAALLALGGPAARAASGPAVEAENGMVVSSQRLASQVGADLLKARGNAVAPALAACRRIPGSPWGCPEPWPGWSWRGRNTAGSRAPP